MCLEIFLKQMWSVNPVFFYYSISVLETVLSHKYTCMRAWRLCLLLGMLDTSVLHGLLKYLLYFTLWQSEVPETTTSSSLLLFLYLILAWALGTGVPLSEKTMFFLQMGWPWQRNILSPPQPTVDWQLCPGKLAYYLARGTLPSIDNQAPRQQNDHKWISAVNVQGLIPSHLETWSLYSLYCYMQKSLCTLPAVFPINKSKLKSNSPCNIYSTDICAL